MKTDKLIALALVIYFSITTLVTIWGLYSNFWKYGEYVPSSQNWNALIRHEN